MPSLSRAVFATGALLASVTLAQAGNKSAFEAPIQDAMPDIAPIAKAPPAGAVMAAAPEGSSPATGRTRASRHRSRLAKAAGPAASARAVADVALKPSLAESPASAAVAVQAVPGSATEPTKPASGNTEPGSATPGSAPVAALDGPREHASGTVAELLAKHAQANGVPLKLAEAVVRIESRGNVRASHAGALGLMQIKYGTARAAGFGGPALGLLIADTNLRYGMKILGDAYRAAGGDTCRALMRYQSGHLASRMSRANQVYCSRARAIMAGA